MRRGESFFAAIVSYRNVQLLARCARSLKAQDVPVTVAVWDNAGDEATREWIRGSDLVDHHVLSSENVYWSPAVNGLVQRFWSGEGVVGMLNDDVALPDHALRRLGEVLARSEVGLVAPATPSIGGPQDVTNCETHRVLLSARGDPGEAIADIPPRRVSYVAGACTWMRSEVWDRLGPLDESMPLGADDHDYCLRAKEAGYQIWVAQNVLVEHEGHASMRVPGADRIWEEVGARSWASFDRKWDGYFIDEEEAILAHWGGEYHEGFERGTGRAVRGRPEP